MRLYEILSESNSSLLKNNINDVVVLIKAQGLASITVDQFYELISNTQTFEKLQLSKDDLVNILKTIDGVRIEPSVDTGVLTVFVDSGQSNKEVTKDDTDEAYASAVSKSAIRAVRKKLGMSRR